MPPTTQPMLPAPATPIGRSKIIPPSTDIPLGSIEHDPEKACPALDAGWVPVFPRDKREAFARRSCSNKKIERDDDSKNSHPALAEFGAGFPFRRRPGWRVPCNGHSAPLCLSGAGNAEGEHNGFTRRTQRQAEWPARPEQSRRAHGRRDVADGDGAPRPARLPGAQTLSQPGAEW